MHRSCLALLLAPLVAVGCLSDDDGAPPVEEPPPPTYTLDDPSLFPEGVAYDEASRSFFVGSLGYGSVHRLSAAGDLETMFEPAQGDWMTLGMKVWPARGELVVCALEDQSLPTTRSEVWFFDVESGERTAAIGLDDAFGQANCNDVAFDDGGFVYVTDRENPYLYRVDRDAETAERWLDDARLAPEVIGCNGAVVWGDHLLVGKYSPSRLFRVERATGEMSEVELTGDALGFVPDGFDGMIRAEEELVVAGNSQLFRLTSDDGWITAEVRASRPPVSIAAVTMAGGQLYGLKGEIVPFVLGTDPDLPFQLLPLD